MENKLWYKQPAATFTEALPLGNGEMGVMAYGGIRTFRAQLDESTFWSGAPYEHNNRLDSADRFLEIRRVLQEKNYLKADCIAEEFVGNKGNFGTNLPVGDLEIEFSMEGVPDEDESWNAECSEYTRSLSLDEGVFRESMMVHGSEIRRTMFVSNPYHAMVLRIESGSPLNAVIRIRGIQNDVHMSDISVKGNNANFSMHGHAWEDLHSDGKSGTFLSGICQLESDGVFSENKNDLELQVCGANTLTMVLFMGTDMFDHHNYINLIIESVLTMAISDYNDLLDKHIDDIRSQMTKMSISLGDEVNLPTDERIRRVQNGADDPALAGLLFQYGRYLLLASSRRNSPLPTHLGGVWNDNLYCRMECTEDMHTDMNLQMQYDLAAPCALAECLGPFAWYIKNVLIPSGSKTARDVYRARGWTAHVMTNPWGFTSLGWGHTWGIFPLGGAWCALVLWNAYCITRDKKALEEHVYPALKGSADFILDYVFWDEEKACFMTGPSYSPENAYLIEGQECFVSLSNTCDLVLIRQTLQAALKAMDLLSIQDDEWRRQVLQVLNHLPSYKIGRMGQLQEWYEDFEEARPGHRHTSHLLGLYPFHEITDKNPELQQAAEKSIEMRLENFEVTSWGYNMLLGYYARLRKAAQAKEILDRIQREILRPNLSSVMSQPDTMWMGTWELDGNTGLTDAILEMLVDSYDHELTLLPALPEEWPNGHIKGVRIEGGHILDLTWHNARPTEVIIDSHNEEPLCLRWKDTEHSIRTYVGRRSVWKKEWSE